MHLSFIFPTALWLLVLLVPLWALALAVPRRLTPPRFWGSLLLRTALVMTLTLALAGAQLVRRVEEVTTVFLIDSSDSVSPSARGQAEAFVRDALNARRAGDRAAVVVFGENALVERTPNDDQVLGRISSVPVAARTNIQSAIQLGLALLPADTHKRLVLLSDGGENAGHAIEAARLAAARGVPISYVDLSTPNGAGEALLVALAAPARVRQGQVFELVATVESSVTQTANLRIFDDTQTLFARNVHLQPGLNRFTLPVETQRQGFQRYYARLVPAIDGRGQNNEAAALVYITGPPRVLLVEGRPGEGQNLKDALGAAQVTAETIAPDALPTDMTGLAEYEAVVLINVPVRALPVKLVANLPAYVRDLGKGLIMIGGDRSFGVGGYGHTPIEEALPVYMDVRDRQERPDVALVFVIDKSGSMDACHCSGPNRQSARPGGTPKIDIAKEAVIQAAAVMGERDTIGVVAFDSSAHWTFPAQRGSSVESLQSALAPVAPEGSTNVRAGLEAAAEALRQADARIKHAILLTDGWSGGSDTMEIARRMYEEGVTLSVVAAGGGSADYLQQLAEAGGGRYYMAVDMEEVPQIFVQETITAVGNYLIEEPFIPQYAAPSPILEGLEDGLPALYGYNGTTLKETAAQVLSGVDGAPVLAQWQYGLGRAVAWTSDVKGMWGRDWVRWPAFPRFAAQLVNWVLPATAATGVAAEIRVEGTQAIIDVQAQDQSGKPRDGLEMRATLMGATGFAQEVALTQIGPGEYHASIPTPIQGTYLVHLAASQNGRLVVQDTVGMVVPYSPEYRQGQSNPALLEALARASGGARLVQPRDAFAPTRADVTRAQEIGLLLLLVALLLLPLDIGVRRLMVRRSDVAAAGAWLRAYGERRAAAPPLGARRRQGRRAVARAPSGPGSDAEASIDASLERLRAARDRARRRARGEE
jgi:Mg-chelatase subunit ChlD